MSYLDIYMWSMLLVGTLVYIYLVFFYLPRTHKKISDMDKQLEAHLNSIRQPMTVRFDQLIGEGRIWEALNQVYLPWCQRQRISAPTAKAVYLDWVPEEFKESDERLMFDAKLDKSLSPNPVISQKKSVS